MIFDYEPLTEEQAMKARYHLLQDGEYDAYVEQSLPKISAKNNAMIELKLAVFDMYGKAYPIKDFLMCATNMIWKIRHFSVSAGLEKEFNEKKFTAELAENKNVRVIIGTQLGNEIPEDKLNGKPKGSRYPYKNIVEDYVVRKEFASSTAKQDEFINDEMPF